MVGVTIVSNERQIIANTHTVERSIMPTVIRNSLNDTAFDIRKHTVDFTYPQAFQVRNKRFIGAALRVEKASKIKLSAAVFDRLHREYLQRHTTGGTKFPRGRNIAIPAGVKRTKSGQISKANRPRALLNKPKVFKTKTRAGQELIIRRKGRKGKNLEVLYILEPRARIKRTFRFYEATAIFF